MIDVCRWKIKDELLCYGKILTIHENYSINTVLNKIINAINIIVIFTEIFLINAYRYMLLMKVHG